MPDVIRHIDKTELHERFTLCSASAVMATVRGIESPVFDQHCEPLIAPCDRSTPPTGQRQACPGHNHQSTCGAQDGSKGSPTS